MIRKWFSSMSEGPAIPAATVQDIDLTASDAALAAEIQRLGNRMELGNETPEEFSKLVCLMVQAGHVAKAEYLLRRNVGAAAGGQTLYQELFGTAKPDEFSASIAGFSVQFEVKLDFVTTHYFLDAVYRIQPCSRRLDEFSFLLWPCEVRFHYSEPDFVSADVSSGSGKGDWPLNWVGGVWEFVTFGR